MAPDGNLEILMAAYQGGDFGAATMLIEQLSPQLHRFFVGQLASRRDADDLLQETWLLIHKVRHTYRTGEPVMPWFYGIARHVRVNHYRRSSRIALHEEQVETRVRSAGANAVRLRAQPPRWRNFLPRCLKASAR